MEGKGRRLPLGQGGDVPGLVPVHLDHPVGRVKIGAGAPRHQNGGHPPAVVQLPDPLQEGGDGLHVPMNHPLHQLVPDHEVGGAGVLVDEQQGGPRLQALHHVGSLGGAAAGVLRLKGYGVLPVGQAVDEHGDIGAPDAPAVLRPDFHGGAVGDDIFAAVPRHVVIDTQLQGLQQGGLPVVAAPHDQGDPPGNPHAGDLPPVGQVQRHRQLPGGAEGHRPLHGPGGHPGLPGQDAAVRHKGAQPQLRELLADILLVVGQLGHRPQPPAVQTGAAQGLLHAPGQVIKQNLLQLPGVDGPPVGREAHLQAQQHVPPLRVQTAGGALQHLRPAAADRDQAALARSFGLEGELGRPAAKLAGQLVLEGQTAAPGLIQGPGKARRLSAHMDAELGGGGKGVPLYMVDGQHIPRELVRPPGVFIGRIAPPVDPGQ